MHSISSIVGKERTLDIRSRRMELGLAQKELVAQAGVTSAQLRKWERGLTEPPRDAMAAIAGALGYSTAALRKAQSAFSRQATPGEGYVTAVSTENVVLPRRLEPPSGKLRVLDLFCGAGGFSHGLEASGACAVTAGLDLLNDRIHTFSLNHPHASAMATDIRTVSLDSLKRTALNPDVIVGGPPCQGFSSIRPFRNLTEGDPRNSLAEYFLLVLGQLRPRWFVFENVVGLLSHQKGQVLQSLLRDFESLGYRLNWSVVNFAYYGLPQNRERLVVVGTTAARPFRWPSATHTVQARSMAGRGAPTIKPAPLSSGALQPAVTVEHAIHDLPPIEAGGSASAYNDLVEPTLYERDMRNGCQSLTLHEATAHSEKMLNIVRAAGTNRAALPDGSTTSGFSSCYSRLHADRPSTTITVNFVHPSSNRCIHPHQDRALTPREGARLQSFPDAFTFHGTRAQIVKQIGNAVPPLFGRILGRALADTE